jgi:hypothetical protein
MSRAGHRAAALAGERARKREQRRRDDHPHDHDRDRAQRAHVHARDIRPHDTDRPAVPRWLPRDRPDLRAEDLAYGVTAFVTFACVAQGCGAWAYARPAVSSEEPTA